MRVADIRFPSFNKQNQAKCLNENNEFRLLSMSMLPVRLNKRQLTEVCKIGAINI